MEESRIKSLMQPAAYPDPVDDVRLIQTHVSWIFLAGKFAYKIKKPVNFGFLDFSTLKLRHFYCQEEVRLNRRLCPGIYLDVIEVSETAGGAAFHGKGILLDYAVKMIRLPSERMADRLLTIGKLNEEDVKRIAATVGDFHLNALRSPDISSYGTLRTIRGNWDENFQQTQNFAGVTISAEDLSLIRKWVNRFMRANLDLFSERVAKGFIRECDGDIHLENICVTEQVFIFDCIEFNDRFRCCDTVADIAFPLMDLEFKGRRDLAEIFLAKYLAVTGDKGALRLLDFYRVYRAFVRGKVESFRLNDTGIPENERNEARETAIRYFRLARGYVLRERLAPTVIVISGLTGSGKSTIANLLAVELGLAVMSSDRLRKELAGIPLTKKAGDDYGEGLYSPARTEAVYRELAARADKLLCSGQGVIIDATCKKRQEREHFRLLAKKHKAAFYLTRAVCPEAIIRQRLEERARQGGNISDGRWDIYLRQRQEFEPLTECERELLTPNGSAPVYDTVDKLLAFMGLPVSTSQ